jgi:putative endonuclease
MYYVYVLQSELDKNFYTGFTKDLKKRIEEHNLNLKDAMKRERYLKTTWGKRYIKNRISNYLKESNKCT